MKLRFLTLILITAFCFAAKCQTLIDAEYFFDVDPGVGSGTPIAFTADTVISLNNIVISTSTLALGYHWLYVRVKDSNGMWSFYNSKRFYVYDNSIIQPADGPLPLITYAEYFVDIDPGLHNGIPITLTADSAVSLDNIQINTSGVSLGYHWLYLRVNDENGTWSIYQSKRFYVFDNSPIQPLNDSALLVQAEYVIDSIPMPFQGFAINLVPDDSISYFDSIPSLVLDSGWHYISLRVKDSHGLWSYPVTSDFHVCETSEPFADYNYSIAGYDLILHNYSTSQDSCLWSFGDGDTSHQFDLVHHYDTAGVYDVQLISVNSCTSDTLLKTVIVRGINSITPNYGGNIGQVTSNIFGSGFVNGIIVKLVQAGVDTIDVSDTSFSIGSFNQIVATFDLTGKEIGFYDVVIEIPLEDTILTLIDGFEVQEGIAGDVTIFKSGTSAVPGREVQYWISLENTGNINKSIDVFELIEPWFTYTFSDPNAEIQSYLPNYFTEDSLDSIPATLKWEILLTAGEVKVLTYKVRLLSTFPIGYTVEGCTFELPHVSEPCSFVAEGCLAAVYEYCKFQSIPCGPDYLLCFALCAAAGAGTCAILALACAGLDAESGHSCAGKIVTAPKDPNEKLVLAEKYIRSDQLLTYVIHYENVGSIEALDVFIDDVIDTALDVTTLNIISAEGASFDSVTRMISWDLYGANLQPDSSGYVIYSIRPKPNLPSGTVIRNTANIQFEVFDINITNETINIIDYSLPEANMDSLPPETYQLTFPISWSSTDSIGAIESYTILVATDSGSYIPYLTNTISTSSVFSGQDGKTYHFICVATDSAGNVEQQGLIAEATTLITCADSLIALNIASDTTLCLGDSVTLIAFASDEYFWSNGDTSQSTTIHAVGDYYLTVAFSGGCARSDTVSVSVSTGPPVPVITPNGPTEFCEGQSVTLTSSNAGGNTWSTGENTVSIVVTEPGEYYVKTTDECGESVSDTLSIGVDSLPTALIVLSGSAAICEGDSVTINASIGTGYSYQWKLDNSNIPGATNSSFAAHDSGSYKVRITTLPGCSKNSPSVLIIVNPNPIVIATAQDTTVCLNDSVILSANGADTYTWEPGNVASQNIQISPAVSTIYSVEGIDPNGCKNQDSILIQVLLPPSVELGNDTLLCHTSTLILDGGNNFISYLWSTGDTSQTIQIDTSFGIDSTVVYWVQVTDTNSCNGLDSINVTLTICTGLNTAVLHDLIIYPNPSSNNFLLSFSNPGQEKVKIDLLNVLSQTQIEIADGFIGKTFSRKIDVAGLPSGVYFVRLTVKDQIITEKLLISR